MFVGVLFVELGPIHVENRAIRHVYLVFVVACEIQPAEGNFFRHDNLNPILLTQKERWLDQ
jgi:hypothetical protein